MTEPPDLLLPDAAAWRAWLEAHQDDETGVWLTLAKKGTTEPTSLSYDEALDEALCFGWIDAVRRGGEHTWSIRFTPRKRASIWSQVNIRRVAELKAEGRMHAAGLAAYEGRDHRRQKKYSFENRDAALSPEDQRRFRADRQAWANFEKMPQSYRHPAIWWVVSAKRADTHERRLATLIADSAAGRKLKHLRRPGDKGTD